MRAILSPVSQGADEVSNYWNRSFALNSRAWVGSICIFFALFLTGCTTPYQQLALPSPIKPAAGTEPERPDTATNLLLGKRGTASNQPTTYAGSGKFTADAGPGAGGAPGVQTGKVRPSAGPTSQVSSDGVTINLSGATIAEVSKTILGDVLGVTYSVSDKLKGSITLNTAHPVSKDSLLKIYESVIRNEGAVLVVKGELYEVVPSADAAAAGAPLRRTSNAGLSSEIIPLRYVSATEMERVLKSSAPQAAVLRADTARNVLVLSGTPSEIAALRELVDVFDVDWMRGMSFGLFPIETADPEAIAKELDVVFANDRDSPSKGIIRFIGNRRLKSVLVISVRPEYLRKAELWIQRIDKVRQATQKQAHVYHVQHRPVNDLAKLLQKVYSGGQGGGSGSAGSSSSSSTSGLDQARPTSAVATGSSTASSGGAATGSAATAAASGSAGGASATPANSAPSSEGTLPADGGGHESSGGGSSAPASDDRSAGISIVADEPNNSLVITATANEYHRLLAILETLDTQPNELLLESTIAEVTLNDQLNFGVRWFFQNKAGNQSVGFADATGKIPGPLAGLSYFINTTNVTVLLNALSNVTDVNVLSQPSLMVLENKKATLQVGDEVPILTQTQQSAATTGTPTISNAVSYRNTGILLSITPRVSNDGKVLLEIEQEVSDTKSNTTSGIDSPSFSQRRVKTTITVQDGQTIVLAGMMQDKATRSRDKVPLVGDIPLVGNIFKNKTDTINRTELLIAITPHVIKDNRQINAVTSEFRDSLNFSTRPQRKSGPDRMENISRIVR